MTTSQGGAQATVPPSAASDYSEILQWPTCRCQQGFEIGRARLPETYAFCTFTQILDRTPGLAQPAPQFQNASHLLQVSK